MKKIILAPIKNEAWILETFLKNHAWADLIVLADQHSTDDTRAIASRFPNVRIIDNDNIGHSNKVRWMLLDEARKEINVETAMSGPNLIFCLDADEIMTEKAMQWTVEKALELYGKEAPQTQLRFQYPWIQLYANAETYRIDKPWDDNIKSMAFLDGIDDDGTRMEYPRIETINDHTERIPAFAADEAHANGARAAKNDLVCPFPVLHLQYIPLKRMYAKQAWYMCNEFAAGKPAKTTNLKYHPALVRPKAKHLKKVDPVWMEHIHIDEGIADAAPDQTAIDHILGLFSEKGIEAFEKLDIWHVDALREAFIKKTGRQPRPDMSLVRLKPFVGLVPMRIKRLLLSWVK